MLKKQGKGPVMTMYPIVLALCEVPHLVLRINKPYIFRPVPGCKKCDELAAQARMAYGPEPELDDCEICGGTRGGVPGNENVIDYRKVCDYCFADILDKKRKERDRAST